MATLERGLTLNRSRIGALEPVVEWLGDPDGSRAVGNGADQWMGGGGGGVVDTEEEVIFTNDQGEGPPALLLPHQAEHGSYWAMTGAHQPHSRPPTSSPTCTPHTHPEPDASVVQQWYSGPTKG